jgi:hypothetical protein
MAAPWEKYRAAPAAPAAPAAQDGPWARYAAPAAPPPPRTADDPSLWEGGRVPGGDVLGDMGGAERFVAGLAMNARNAGYGLLESAVSGGPNAAIARKLRDAALPQQQSVRGLIAGGEDNRDMLQRAEQWLIDRQQANAPEDDALNDTWGGKAGNFTGYAAQLLLPAGLAKAAGNVPQLARAKSGLEALYAAAMPTTFQGAAMQGSLLGAAQPVAEGDSRVANAGVGAVAGPLGMLLGRGIGKFTQAVVSPFRQISNQAIEQRAADVLRSEADDVTRLMVPQPSAVPGVRRTLAEESLDPGIARLERNARGTGGGFDALDRANNAARVSSLRDTSPATDFASGRCVRRLQIPRASFRRSPGWRPDSRVVRPSSPAWRKSASCWRRRKAWSACRCRFSTTSAKPSMKCSLASTAGIRRQHSRARAN